MEDLASIGKKDIEKIFPPPHAAAQTKRLGGVMKFNVDLSYVQFFWVCMFVYVYFCVYLKLM